jgi:hypothetical protein
MRSREFTFLEKSINRRPELYPAEIGNLPPATVRSEWWEFDEHQK